MYPKNIADSITKASPILNVNMFSPGTYDIIPTPITHISEEIYVNISGAFLLSIHDTYGTNRTFKAV